MQRVILLSIVIAGVYSQMLGGIGGGFGDDIGIYRGQLHGIDDIHHSRYHDLRHGLGIGGVGGVIGGGVVVAGGGIRVGGHMGLRACQLGACTLQFIPPQCEYIPIFRDMSGRYCRGCPENICMGGLHRRGGIGGIGGIGGVGGVGGIGGGRRGNNRRLRRIRRRLCRTSGMCFGDALGPVGMGGVGLGGVGLGGVGVVGGVGAIGGVGAVGGGLGWGGGLGGGRLGLVG